MSEPQNIENDVGLDAEDQESPWRPRQTSEQSIHARIVELDSKLRQLAQDARALAVPILRDRKFDLETRQGWEELVDAARSASKSAATETTILTRLQCLASAWIQTQTRLSFFARTRPNWNT